MTPTARCGEGGVGSRQEREHSEARTERFISRLCGTLFREEIMMQDPCPRCGSDKIIPDLPLLDHYGDVGGFANQAEVQVHGVPRAWVFKDTAEGKLTLRVCGECGHAELSVSNFRELYERYEKSRQK